MAFASDKKMKKTTKKKLSGECKNRIFPLLFFLSFLPCSYSISYHIFFFSVNLPPEIDWSLLVRASKLWNQVSLEQSLSFFFFRAASWSTHHQRRRSGQIKPMVVGTYYYSDQLSQWPFSQPALLAGQLVIRCS